MRGRARRGAAGQCTAIQGKVKIMRYEIDAYIDDPEFIDAHPAWYTPDERIINRPRKEGFLFPSLDGEGDYEYGSENLQCNHCCHA